MNAHGDVVDPNAANSPTAAIALITTLLALEPRATANPRTTGAMSSTSSVAMNIVNSVVIVDCGGTWFLGVPVKMLAPVTPWTTSEPIVMRRPAALEATMSQKATRMPFGEP